VNWLTLLFLFLTMLSPVLAHEGEDHGDLRDTKKPPAASRAAGAQPPKITQGQFTVAGKTYTLRVEQTPPAPVLGEEIHLDFRVVQSLTPPDPILGAEMAIEGAQFKVVQARPGTEDLGTAEQASPGNYSVHWTPHQAGTALLQFTGPSDLTFSLEVAVARPLKQKLAVAVAAGAVMMMLLASLARRKLLGAGWIVTGVLSGTALALGFWPSTPPHTHQVAETTTSEESTSGIVVPVDLQRDLGMKVAALEVREVEQTLKVPGQVRVREGATHNVHARFTSRIVSGVPQVGRRVQAGEELAVLQEVLSSADRVSMRGQQVDLRVRELEFATQQNALRRQMAELEARRQVATSERIQRERDLRRSEQLYAIQVLPLKELQAARTAFRQAEQELAGLGRQIAVLREAPRPPQLPDPVGLQQYALTAPVAGVVSKVEAAAEEVVEPSKVLLTIVDLSTVWVSARVSEADLGSVRQAGTARVSTTAYPGPFIGRFASVSPSLDPETRTAQVFFAVDNREGKLLDGMSAQVELVGAKDRVLTIPTQAVMTQDGESRVFVQVAPDRFEPRTVRISRKAGDQSVIESGLQSGAKVVVSGAGTLVSELARRGQSR
jgi:RND family efflux transporter MFP subunit